MRTCAVTHLEYLHHVALSELVVHLRAPTVHQQRHKVARHAHGRLRRHLTEHSDRHEAGEGSAVWRGDAGAATNSNQA